MPDTTANVLSDQNAPEQPSRRRTKHIGLLGLEAIALYINNADNPLVIDISQEAILGRFTPNSPSQPRVDLMPYGAYEKGVSRMHAVIRRTASGGLTVEDLLSNNGTYLNGVRLPPRVPYQLASGNRIKLGQLEIEVYFGDDSQAPAPVHDRESSMTTRVVPATPEAPAPTEQPSTSSAAPVEKAGETPAVAGEVSTRSLPGESQVVILTHYHGEVAIDPAHVFSEVGRITEDVLRHFMGLIGYEVTLKLEIDVRGRQGFEQSTIQAIDERTRFLKFTRSEFDAK
jgi:pSer/pThr/pTyr-binding forkhead associated (FHA) protein